MDIFGKIAHLKEEASQQFQFELGDAAAAMRVTAGNGLCDLFGFDPQESFLKNSDLFSNEIYIDVIARRAVDFMEQVKDMKKTLEPLCQNMHVGGDRFWRNDLKPTSSFAEVSEQAQLTISKLRGQDLRRETEAFSKVS